MKEEQIQKNPVNVKAVELLNKYYSRDAGRWCETCQQTGSHHTDKHYFYVDGALKLAEYDKENSH